MGILDDAIREHLDLKRQQGAADDELKRLEDEAFGPPSRPGDPDFPQAAEEAAGEAEIAAAPAEGHELASEEILPEADAAAEPETVEPEPEAVEPEPEAIEAEAGLFDQGTGDLDLDLDLEEPAEEVADLTVEEPEAEGDAPIETLPTVEHHFEEALDEADVVEEEQPSDTAAEGEGDEGDEDVLEETPEFLRDAPEDDELWFEQGEPKDFDF